MFFRNFFRDCVLLDCYFILNRYLAQIRAKFQCRQAILTTLTLNWARRSSSAVTLHLWRSQSSRWLKAL